MPSRDPQPSLENLLENIARIERDTCSAWMRRRFSSMTEPGTPSSGTCSGSVRRRFRLGPQAEELCPGIPWRDIRGIGNLLRHGYDRIDPHVIGRTVTVIMGPGTLARRDTRS